jgi:hypothetical protein
MEIKGIQRLNAQGSMVRGPAEFQNSWQAKQL